MIGSTALAAYVRALWAWNPAKTGLTVALMAATAITDGIALLSLLPLLALAGIGSGQAKFWFVDHNLTLPQALGIFVLLIAVRTGIKASRDFTQTELRNGFVDQLRIDTFAAISHMRWQQIMKRRPSDLNETLLGDVDRVGMCTFYLLRLVSTAGVGAAYTGIALHLSVTGFAAAVGIAAFMMLTQRRIFRDAHAIGRDLGAYRRQLAAAAATYLGGIKLAKSINGEQRQVQDFATAIAAMRRRQTQFSTGQIRSRGLHEMGGAMVLAVLVWLMIVHLQVPTGQVLLMIAIMARLLPMSAEIQQNVVQILHNLPAYTSLQNLLATCRDHSDAHLPQRPAPTLTQSVVFRDVQFRYGPDEPLILDTLNLTFPARQTTALMGPSGAGKSTVADLLVGLIAPTGGQILIDGVPLDDGMIRDWRSHLAYVPQEVTLLHDTIRANLVWGAVSFDDDALWEALTQAAAADFVRALPDGLETMLGERGIGLSGGERQRLALARAFLRRPSLLILDEATSALDPANEQAIKLALRQIHGSLTVVLIAHRLSTVEGADQIIRIQPVGSPS